MKNTRSARMARARKLASHTPFQWVDLVRFCNFTCVRCGFRRGDDYVERDHITPVYLGGSVGIEKLQPVCARRNSSKGPECIDYRPEGWRDAVFGKNSK